MTSTEELLMERGVTYYEIMTLKIFVTLKRYTETTLKNIYKGNHSPLLFKDNEITLKNFQRYSFLLFPGFSALL